jgi:hypothetical protein
MAIIGYDRLEIWEYLKQSLDRLRELAKVNPSAFSTEMQATIDEIAEDTKNLEAELIAGGYLPKPANEP